MIASIVSIDGREIFYLFSACLSVSSLVFASIQSIASIWICNFSMKSETKMENFTDLSDELCSDFSHFSFANIVIALRSADEIKSSLREMEMRSETMRLPPKLESR